jgi:hypothetical protein
VHAPFDLRPASRTFPFAIDLEVLPQREDSAQFQKTEREDAGVGDDGPELGKRDIADFREWADPRAEQHLVFDDVTNARENGLIEQNIRDFGTRKCAHFLERGTRVPLVGHHVRGEVVCPLCVRIFYESHGRCPNGHLSIGKIENKARRACAPVVARHGFTLDGCGKRAPKHEVNAKRERVELKDEMFAPGENLVHG